MYLNEDNKLIINREELLRVGINENTVKQALNRDTVLSVGRGEYLYDTLAKDWQGLVERTLCGGKNAFSYTVAKQKNEVLKGLLEVIREEDKTILSSYRIEKFNESTGEVITTTTLPKEVIAKYMQKCRWLNLLVSYNEVMAAKLSRDKFNKLNKTFFQNKSEFQLAIIQLANEKEEVLPLNLRVLDRLISKYKDVGARAVISGKYGSANAKKVNEEQVEYLTWLMGQQSTTGYAHAAEIFNRISQERNWEAITEKTVQNWMTNPTYHQVWYLHKYGWFAWKKIYEFSIKTMAPSFKNALWVYDDTKHNLFYRAVLKVNGKDEVITMAKLNVAVMIDAFSGMVLSRVFFEGKPSISVVQECMREALKTSKGELPYQILYDGDSAPVNYFKRFDGVHFKAMPYNGQSKPIEKRFGDIQQRYYRLYEHHTGQNVTARSEKSIHNKELVARLEKEGELPTKDKAIEQGKIIFHVANHDTPKGSKSAYEKYQLDKYPEGYVPRKLTPEDKISLLWQEHDTKNLLPYTNVGIEFKVDKIKYSYVALDSMNLPDQSKIGHKFKVFYDVENISKAIALFTEDYRFVGLAYEKEVFARAVYDMKEGERARLSEILTNRKGQRTPVINDLKTAYKDLELKFASEKGTTDFDNIGFNYGKGVLEAMEKAYYAELADNGERAEEVETTQEEEQKTEVMPQKINTKKYSIFNRQ